MMFMQDAAVKNRVIFSVIGLFMVTLAFSQSPLKIMPLGNSITFDSNIADISNPRYAGERISYRYKLYQLLTEEGYTFDFVGNRNTGFFYFPDGDNAGFPGIETGGLLNLIKTGYNNVEKKYEISPYPRNYLAAYLPDIILLHIGTNGLQDASDAETFKNDVNSMLNEVDAIESTYNMTIPVFLAKIINRSPNHSPTTTYNYKLGQMVSARTNDEIEIVNMETGANIDYDLEPDGDMADTWHPNNSGYEKMAIQWFNALENYNFRPPVISTISDQAINENQNFSPIQLDNYVFDPQERDDEMTWQVSPANPVHLNYEITSNRQLIVSAKDPQWNGTETLTLIVTDPSKGGNFYSDQEEISFTVNFVNDVPVITGQNSVSINEDTQYTVVLSDLIVIDDDNNYPQDFTLEVAEGENYIIQDQFTIIPTENFYGTVTVPVRVYDGLSYSQYFDLQISVSPVNDLPVITGQHFISKNEDSKFLIEVTDLKISDIDNVIPYDFSIYFLEGENYEIVNDSIVPELNYHGQLTVPVRVYDGTDYSEYFNVDVNINSVNDRPLLIFPSTNEFYEDDPVNENLSYFDPDNDPNITISLIDRPNWLFYSKSNYLLYGNPGNNDVGVHQAVFRISDGYISYDTIWEAEIINVNDPPIIEGQASELKIYKNNSLVISVNDLQVSDVDNVFPDDFDLKLYAGQHYSVLTENTVTPERDYTGELKVAVQVSDGIDNSGIGEITVTVEDTSTITNFKAVKPVSMYPIPADNHVTIFSDYPMKELKILSITGLTAYNQMIDGTHSMVVNTNAIASGTYIVQITLAGEQKIIEKLIVKH